MPVAWDGRFGVRRRRRCFSFGSGPVPKRRRALLAAVQKAPANPDRFGVRREAERHAALGVMAGVRKAVSPLRSATAVQNVTDNLGMPDGRCASKRTLAFWAGWRNERVIQVTNCLCPSQLFMRCCKSSFRRWSGKAAQRNRRGFTLIELCGHCHHRDSGEHAPARPGQSK